MRRSLAFVLVATLVVPGLRAEEVVDWEVVGRIREEGFRHSQVEELVRHLSDGIGPRVTNSPQMREASRWTRDKFLEWGLRNAELSRFDFGAGWDTQHCSVQLRVPYEMQLEALPLAWTPGTEGPVRGRALKCDVSDIEQWEKWLSEQGDLNGRILFLDKPRPIDIAKLDVFSRHDATSLADACSYDVPPDKDADEAREQRKKLTHMRERIFAVAKERGIVALAYISSRDAGVVRATEGGDPDAARRATIPGFALSAEHYNRILRDLEKGDVELEIDIRARFHDEDWQGENTLADIVGTSKKREVVMAGAHLDSWHGGTGATDNAAGCAVVMEAARILQAIDAKLARTVRFVLWSGEEQGLLGSEAYCDHVFVQRPAVSDSLQLTLPRRHWEPTWPIRPLPEHERFSVYFNLDNGSGRVRGVYAQENSGAVPILRAWLEPFADLGADQISMNNTGGTDHQSFDRVGLPGFQFIQDQLGYFPRTHHSNLDVYDHLSIEDLKVSAVIMASFLYHAANRDERFPRKPMPVAPVEKPVPAAATSALR